MDRRARSVELRHQLPQGYLSILSIPGVYQFASGQPSFRLFTNLQLGLQFSLALLFSCLLSEAAQAQLPRVIEPPSTQPLPEQSPQPTLPPPSELLQPPGTTPPAIEEPAAGDAPKSILVEEFQVTGSTVFSPEEFAKVTKPFTKHPISLAELFQARTAVTKLYLDNGYITSGAYIPPQKLQGGIVEIRVVEGGLEDIKVKGTSRLNPAYIRSRIAIAAGPPLNRDRLLQALQLLQTNPLIQSLSAELSAGTRPGVSLLELDVKEAKTFSAQLAFDNNRSPSVGTDRRKLQASEGNLLGLGDSISAAYTNTDGSNAGDFSYTIPVSPYNTTVSFNFGTSSSNVLEKPFNVLDIESKSHYYELTLRHPLLQTPNREFALGLSVTRRDSQATLLGGIIPFPSLGADANGKTKITSLQFFQEWTQRSSHQVIALRSQFNLGLNAFDSTINATPPDSRFFSWRGQAQLVQLLGPETLLLVRGDLQLANRALLPLEQFGLGGQETIRGYRQDLLLTDNGALLSAEVRFPILRLPNINGVLQLAPFIDLGKTWNNASANPDPNTLASVGLGLRFQLGDRLTARFEWGIPLVSVSGNKNTAQENGVYFSITGTLF